jgi:predicted nucleotidyltransferase
MRTLAIPEELLKGVLEVFQPDRVILFGSHARGEENSDSDFDLLVVVPDDTPQERLTLAARRAARLAFRKAADIVPCRRSVFERKLRVPGSLASIANSQGVVVYERS